MLFSTSSTVEELKEKRSQLSEGVYECNHVPIYWETFLAGGKPAREVMMEHLNSCHVYLRIFASRYSGPTEIEYKRARELQIPVICFVKDGVRKRDNELGKLIKTKCWR